MTDRAKPKSCSSQTGARSAEAEAGCGARKRLGRRVAAAKVRAGHDYIDTLTAARRRKTSDKQARLMNELRALLIEMRSALRAREMKAALRAGVPAQRSRAPSPDVTASLGKRGRQR